MAGENQGPLVELCDSEGAEKIKVHDEVQCCFVRLDFPRSRPITGTVAALCASERYLQSALEYMNTRRLLFRKVTSEQTQR